MQWVRVFLVLLTGAVACTDRDERERPAVERPPYGDLEVAETEEVSTPAAAPAPDDSSTTGAESDDRAGYVAYPASPARDTAPAEPDDTSTRSPKSAADTVATPIPAPPAPASPAPASPAPTSPSPAAPAPASPPPATPVAEPSSGRPSAEEVTRVVAAGTVIHAALVDSIHSRHDVSGKVVTAKVVENVRGPDGLTLVPAGAPVHLTVTQVKPGRGDRKGVLEIRADSITIGSASRTIEASLRPVPHELRGRGVTAEDAAKVGVGAAGGAVAGRVIGGDAKGAVIGGVVGAAGGAVVASETAAKDVVVRPRTPFVLVLSAPLSLGR